MNLSDYWEKIGCFQQQQFKVVLADHTHVEVDDRDDKKKKQGVKDLKCSTRLWSK